MADPRRDAQPRCSGSGSSDAADDESRMKVYESFYGIQRCCSGFVAMYFEWPNVAAAASISDDSHLAGPSAVPATEDDSGLDVH